MKKWRFFMIGIVFSLFLANLPLLAAGRIQAWSEIVLKPDASVATEAVHNTVQHHLFEQGTGTFIIAGTDLSAVMAGLKAVLPKDE